MVTVELRKVQRNFRLCITENKETRKVLTVPFILLKGVNFVKCDTKLSGGCGYCPPVEFLLSAYKALASITSTEKKMSWQEMCN